jgi:hypothetical protein
MKRLKDGVGRRRTFVQQQQQQQRQRWLPLISRDSFTSIRDEWKWQ